MNNFALVSISTMQGKVVKQVNAEGGVAEFAELAPGRYTLRVVAEGFEAVKQTIEVSGGPAVASVQLRHTGENFVEQTAVSGLYGTGSTGFMMQNDAQAHRRMLKISQYLRDNKPDKARLDLERLYLDQPFDASLNYLYGLYEKEVNDVPRAKFYWQKAVSLDSKNLAALLELGHIELDQGNAAEAIPYLRRAVQASPTSWHSHALLVLAYCKQKEYAEAINEADRALDLGHGQAALVMPMLASALAAQGDKERAVQVLQEFLKDHPDSEAQGLLDLLNSKGAAPSGTVGEARLLSSFDTPLLPSVWMPAGVDDAMPPVEPGVQCPQAMVLQKASERITELVQNVDRFEATESMEHRRINGIGIPTAAQLRTYRYLVSIGELRPGLLSVEEFRDAPLNQDSVPDGVQTIGLPAMVLVFHPLQLDNYKFTCEGLAHTGAGLTWQVHFQQRPDRIPTLHAYALGDQSFAVGLKGRAWITADSFQIVRLITDLVKSYPEIRLAAEHTAIEYGPVRFRRKDVQMWLPQKAEVYFDWRGKRVHRSLSYSNFMLYSVDEKQKIMRPKNADQAASAAEAVPATSKPN